jgi:D-alanine-D-alanine ligase
MGYSIEQTAEFEAPETVDAIETALVGLKHDVERIGHVKNLVQRLAAGVRWDLVFNVAEGLHGLGRESQIPSLLEAYQIPYTFSDPLTLNLCLHKGVTKQILSQNGIANAPFIVVSSAPELSDIQLNYPMFVKPVAEGTSKGIYASSRVSNMTELTQVVTELLGQYANGVLIEEYLPGREFTVGILGRGDEARVIGAMEIVFTLESGDFYRFDCKQGWALSPRHEFPNDDDARASEVIALQAWRALGCQDAGRVDVRFDAKGFPNIIEVNPIAGLRPGYSDLCLLSEHFGLSFAKLIEEIIRYRLA